MLAIGLLFVVIVLGTGTSVEPGSFKLAVDLLDGSRVIGIPENRDIRLRTDFAELVIPLQHIDLLRWKQDRENVIVRLHNGDTLSGGIVPEPLKLQTLFGAVLISMQHVDSIETLLVESVGRPPINDGLILYYPFDEQPIDQIVINSAQDKHHGKLIGARWTSTGRRGGAFTFAHTDDRIEIVDDPGLHLQHLTLCAWVLPQDDKHDTWRGVLAKSTSGNWTNGFGLARYNGRPDVHFYVNYYSAETASKVLPDNRWSHLAATYNGKNMVLYMNGVRASEAVATSYGGPIRYGAEPLLIGAAPTGYHWIGKIDEVMIFNRVLSDQEVERIYRRTQ